MWIILLPNICWRLVDDKLLILILPGIYIVSDMWNIQSIVPLRSYEKRECVISNIFNIKCCEAHPVVNWILSEGHGLFSCPRCQLYVKIKIIIAGWSIIYCSQIMSLTYGFLFLSPSNTRWKIDINIHYKLMAYPILPMRFSDVQSSFLIILLPQLLSCSFNFS